MQTKYQVAVIRREEKQALAETRGHHLLLNIQKGSGDMGSMPPRH